MARSVLKYGPEKFGSILILSARANKARVTLAIKDIKKLKFNFALICLCLQSIRLLLKQLLLQNDSIESFHKSNQFHFAD